jgi:K+-transporting ATPase A subunit
MGLPKDGVQKAMKIIENEVFRNTKAKKSNQMSLEERLSNILLSNKMQANMYNQVRELKYYTDQLMMNQSAESINKYRNVILQSIDSAVEVYELLKGRGILELNAIVILASFYLVNLSDITLKNPHKFTDLEISNTLNTFLAAMGASEHVNGSSYNGLVRISINWLLSHQTN